MTIRCSLNLRPCIYSICTDVSGKDVQASSVHDAHRDAVMPGQTESPLVDKTNSHESGGNKYLQY